MEILKVREILVKKPFFEITPEGYKKHGAWTTNIREDATPNMPEDSVYRNIKTQADFLREFYPTGHRIFDTKEYPDIWQVVSAAHHKNGVRLPAAHPYEARAPSYGQRRAVRAC